MLVLIKVYGKNDEDRRQLQSNLDKFLDTLYRKTTVQEPDGYTLALVLPEDSDETAHITLHRLHAEVARKPTARDMA